MVFLAFALLTILGAWQTWHHNPLYSARSTVRGVVLVGLAIGAVMAGLIMAVQLTGDRSAPVALGTIAAVIVAGALVLIFVIETLTAPRTAPLPSTAHVLHVNRQRVHRWALRFGTATILMAALAIAASGEVRIAIVVIGSTVLLIGAVLLATLYLVARQGDRALTSLELNPWIHWHYPPAQWAAWTDVRVARMRAAAAPLDWRGNWPKLAAIFAITAALIFYIAIGPWQTRAAFAVGCFASLMALMALAARYDPNQADARRAALLRAASDVYFGQDGAFCDGVLTPWLSVNAYLTAASIDERPPRSLVLQFERVPAGSSGTQVVQADQAVLIPDGVTDGPTGDLARLQRELTARCPKARIALGA
jgi:hypothetical protein